MSEFRRYIHIERFGHSEVVDINLGTTHIFPKIDGTNASVWLEDVYVHAGSRKRHLSENSDNHGFWRWTQSESAFGLHRFLHAYPEMRLFGEWLVPHTIKTYRDDAWHRFYVFDVVRRTDGKFVPYDVYSEWMEEYSIDYVPIMATGNNISKDQLHVLAEKNDYLMKPGHIGEGIVIKNYDFVNQYGRTVWAKMVRSEFTEANHKEMGAPAIEGKEMVEQKIAHDCVTKTLVEKERAKIEGDFPQGPIQPRLLNTVYHCVVIEELWNMLKVLRDPTIDFKLLRRMVFARVKHYAEDLF